MEDLKEMRGYCKLKEEALDPTLRRTRFGRGRGPAVRQNTERMTSVYLGIRRAQVKVGLINLCKGLFSLNARIYYKLKSGT
jgi:hypothetical protein